jgi:hypothetical protein
VELAADRQPLVQFASDTAVLIGFWEFDHVPLAGGALGRAAADHPANAVFGRQIKRALESALDSYQHSTGWRSGAGTR